MPELFEKLDSQYARCAADIAGYLASAKIDLYTAVVPLSETTTKEMLEDLVADYNGYAQGTLTWQTPSISDDGVVESIGTCAVFVPSDALQPNSIVGAYVTGNDDGPLLFFGPLADSPISMNSTRDRLTVVVRYRPGTDSVTVIIS